MAQPIDNPPTAPPPAKLPREIVALGWISFCLDVASEMVYPLVPLFAVGVLHAPGLALGLIEGSAEGLLAIMTAVSGRYSDRIRKRVPFIRAGYGIAAAAKPLIALVGSWPALLALRALDRFGKGLRTAARDALIADLAGPKRHGAAFGFHRTMDTAGAFVGVLLALVVLHFLPEHYRLMFALTALPGALAIALTFRIREPPREVAVDARAPRVASNSKLPRAIWPVCAVLWLFALGNSSDAFLLLRAKSAGFSVTQVIAAYALMNLVYTLAAFPAGKLSDRWGRARVIALGWLIYAAVYAGFASLDAPALWVAFAVYGLHLGLVQGVAKAWIADHAPPELRATALGVYQFGLGIALLASSAVAGWLWDADATHAAPFYLGSAFALAASALLPWAARKR